MTEKRQEQSVLRKVMLSVAAVTFLVLMAADISRAMTIVRADAPMEYYIARAILYFMAATMLFLLAFHARRKKVFYGTFIVMVLIIVCDFLMARGFTSELIIPTLGCSVIQVADDKWDKSLVRVAAKVLIVAFILIAILGKWDIEDDAEFRKDAAEFKKHPVTFRLVTREVDYDSYKRLKKKKWYYEINTKKDDLLTFPFDYEKPEIIESWEAYESYDSDQNNEVQWKRLNFVDEKGKKVDLTSEQKEIIKEGAKIDHPIMCTRIYTLNNDYYAEFELNVNFWSPFAFYEYDKKHKRLKEICTFNDESVVGIKRVK